jgi:DNA-binding transcriptional regulator YiaG
MLNPDTLANFKLTIIRWLEEFLLEKVTQLDPDAVTTENEHIYSPCQGQIISINARLEVALNFLEKYFKISDEFWKLKYQWLQEAYALAHNDEELHKFFNSEIPPFLDLFKDIDNNKLLSRIITSSSEEDSSKSEANLSDRVCATVFSNEDYLTHLCAAKAATELLQRIDLHNLSLSTLKSLLGIPPKPTPVTESRLPEVTGLPTPPPLRASVESNYRLDKWKRDSNNFGVFEAACKTNPKNRVEVFIAGEKDGDILAWEAARQVIDLIGIDAAKLQLVFASHVFNRHHLFQSKFSLKATDIIKQIGWDKKHRLTVSEKLTELASIAFHLGRMLMQCTWVEGKPKGNKVDASVSISPLWVIEVEARGQMNMFTGKVDAPDEVYITVNPGPWAEKWLNKMGVKAGIALHQFGWLATEILKIDPYHDELALKLAIHLTMVTRIKVRDKNQYEHKVGTLLEAVELEARINAARQEKREAYNLKQRWDNALTLLMSMHWRVIFDDATYPDWLRPDSQAEKPSDWKKEKIIDQLWKAKLTIKPPEPIPALLATKTEPKQLKPIAHTKSEPTLTGAELRKQREAKGVSQTALAEWAGKTKAWLCMVEKGKRKIDPKEAKKLWAGIDFLANKSAQP